MDSEDLRIVAAHLAAALIQRAPTLGSSPATMAANTYFECVRALEQHIKKAGQQAASAVLAKMSEDDKKLT